MNNKYVICIKDVYDSKEEMFIVKKNKKYKVYPSSISKDQYFIAVESYITAIIQLPMDYFIEIEKYREQQIDKILW